MNYTLQVMWPGFNTSNLMISNRRSENGGVFNVNSTKSLTPPTMYSEDTARDLKCSALCLTITASLGLNQLYQNQRNTCLFFTDHGRW
ncbi:hypothetical protein P5673_016837 [Acropora cervicornis]|uniref:Uncharacterized protein n=1 Tax=Acropora cervicornis TaxID=6130 RepID=A0AAD9QFT3_ACRCE|nr:hypothetical protein P5673_016837 [Acropora cervicornis]